MCCPTAAQASPSALLPQNQWALATRRAGFSVPSDPQRLVSSFTGDFSLYLSTLRSDGLAAAADRVVDEVCTEAGKTREERRGWLAEKTFGNVAPDRQGRDIVVKKVKDVLARRPPSCPGEIIGVCKQDNTRGLAVSILYVQPLVDDFIASVQVAARDKNKTSFTKRYQIGMIEYSAREVVRQVKDQLLSDDSELSELLVGVDIEPSFKLDRATAVEEGGHALTTNNTEAKVLLLSVTYADMMVRRFMERCVSEAQAGAVMCEAKFDLPLIPSAPFDWGRSDRGEETVRVAKEALRRACFRDAKVYLSVANQLFFTITIS